MTAAVKEHTLEIKEIIDEVDNVKTFRMQLPEDFPMNFYPGQFFMVRFPDNEKLKRAYSVASSPTEEGILDITLDKVGEFTGRLWETNPGGELIFQGPYGRFYFEESMKQNVVLIAGGLGITPMRSVVRYIKDKKLPNKINAIYSVKRPGLIVYQKEFESYKDEIENYTFIPTVTRPEDSDEWGGRTGRIDIDLIKENSENPKEDIFFLCGSNEFVKRIREMLYELGVSKEQIKCDIWGE